MRDHYHARALSHPNRLLQFVPQLPVEIEFRAQDRFLSPIRSNETEGHIFAAQMHVRHEPHELSILTEFQFTAGLPIRLTRWNTLAWICEGFRRQCDEMVLRWMFRLRETDFSFVRTRF